MPLRIDAAHCVSCGMCEERLPAVFRIDRTARCARIVRQPLPEETDDAYEAAEDCPVGAIIAAHIAPTS